MIYWMIGILIDGVHKFLSGEGGADPLAWRKAAAQRLFDSSIDV
jgi:hypothetical protein